MKTLKLVTGILCTVISLFVLFQSCAAGLAETISEDGGTSGAGGLLVAVALLVGGIVTIVTHKSEGKGGSIACIILFLFGALLGFANAGIFKDLQIWSGLCLIMAAIHLLSVIRLRKKGS